MAQLFEEEKKYPDNRARMNFVFLGYPFTPPLPAADYRKVVKELEAVLPLRLWYFLDEITTAEMMRKIWRALLRADLAIFDISGGNPNVAFELGLGVAQNKSCITILKAGAPNPLGSADLGYAERAEYDSATSLKARLSDLLTAKSSAIRLLRELSYELLGDDAGVARDEIETRLVKLLVQVYTTRQVAKSKANSILGSERLGSLALNKLREKGVLKVEGAKRGARWVFSDSWVNHDHEVSGA